MTQQQLQDIVESHDIFSEWLPPVLDEVDDAMSYLECEDHSHHLDRTHGSIRHDLIGIKSASMIAALIGADWPVERSGRYLVVR